MISLFASLETALGSMNLEATALGEELCFPEERQVIFLKSKLPDNLKTMVKNKLKFMDSSFTKEVRKFYKVVIEVATNYDWVDEESSDEDGGHFDNNAKQRIKKIANEVRKEQKLRINARIQNLMK